MERVLVFAAHTDDELTMAGTIWRLAQAGTPVHVIIMTDGCEGAARARRSSCWRGSSLRSSTTR